MLEAKELRSVLIRIGRDIFEGPQQTNKCHTSKETKNKIKLVRNLTPKSPESILNLMAINLGIFVRWKLRNGAKCDDCLLAFSQALFLAKEQRSSSHRHALQDWIALNRKSVYGTKLRRDRVSWGICAVLEGINSKANTCAGGR